MSADVRKLFLSYNFENERLVQRIWHYLNEQPGIDPYFFTQAGHDRSFVDEIGRAIKTCDVFVIFVLRGGDGDDLLGKTQKAEMETAVAMHKRRILVCLAERPLPPGVPPLLNPSYVVRLPSADDAGAHHCAREIATNEVGMWCDTYGLPLGYPFEYEKDVIREFVAGRGRLGLTRIGQGCPEAWPTVARRPALLCNPVSEDEIGGHTGEEASGSRSAQVVAAALTDFHSECLVNLGLTFPVASPKARLAYPSARGRGMKVGMLVSGGIAPGANAVIAGAFRRHAIYAEKGRYALEVLGYYNGFRSVLDSGANYRRLNEAFVKEHAAEGGSMLGASRCPELTAPSPADREQALRSILGHLQADGIEILHVIGGDGSMKAAHALQRAAQNEGRPLSVVAIPKTMDNDILWVWQSFGFLSAVDRAKQAVIQLRTEAMSASRLCIIQLFGSDSGFVVSHAALASGVCDLCLIPEVQFSMASVADYVGRKLGQRYHQDQQKGRGSYGVILMAETAIPTDVEQYVDDPDIGLSDEERQEMGKYLAAGRRVNGKTPDPLRTGALKVVSRVLERSIRELDPQSYWRAFQVFANEPRHLLRAIAPSSSDLIIGERLGALAVDCTMAGFTDFMISQWLTEYVMVPLRLVVLGRKRIPPQGMFWKSVRASTGQPANLT